MNGNIVDTDELSFVVNNVNECNIDVYRRVYEIAKTLNSNFIDDRVIALMDRANDYEPSFVSLHINTIFLEYIRVSLNKMGVSIIYDINLLEALEIYESVVEISNSPDLVSCIQELSDDIDILDISNRLGIDLSKNRLLIEDHRKFINDLYINNKEAIYREIEAPVSLPSVL